MHGKEQDFSFFILQVEECIDTDGAKLMDAKNLLSFFLFSDADLFFVASLEMRSHN